MKTTPLTLAQLDNRENNITLIRLLAAWGVLFSHSWALAGFNHDLNALDQLFKAIMPFDLKVAGASVSAFFFLSGFLIARSFERSKTLFDFVSARLFRIYPALWVNLIFCTFVVGAFFTALPLTEYLTHSTTWKYLTTNGVMWQVFFQLPPAGELFPGNPNPNGINGSLWTLPAEIRCYAYLAILGSIGFLRNRITVNVTALILLFLPYIQPEYFILFPGNHFRLAVFFLVGVLAYHNRDLIPFSFETFLGLSVLCFLAHKTPLYEIVGVVTFSYFLMLLAFHPKLSVAPIDQYGDYSYGLYLYAFPVQQALVALLPGIGPWSLFVSASVVTFLLAFGSWHLVENPDLQAGIGSETR